MKTRKVPQSKANRLNSTIFLGIFIVLAALVALPVYSGRASSTPKARSAPVEAQLPSHPGRAAWSSRFQPLQPVSAAFLESVSTFDGTDCTTPKTDFNLGDTVCVKASGVPASLFPWRISWVDPVGFIRQSDPASIDDSTTYTYTLPATPTTEVNGQTVDNRGNWRVNLTRSNGAIRQTARFTVHEQNNAQADVFVQKFQRDSNNAIHAGDNVAFIIQVSNAGPDTSVTVHLVDSVPAGGTLVSFTQNSGPVCSPAAVNDCVIASIANGDTAEFTAVYGIPSNAAPGPHETSATVSSATADPNNTNDSSTAEFAIQSGTGGAGTCEITCPSDITVSANTTEGSQRGAHVTYSDPASTGTCGSISSTPASGSFFPVGTTVVNVTSETGGGSCTFTVAVEETNGNVSITCPPNKQGDANASCEASFNLGNPTTTGDNVTITVSRSDGQPMYDCDVNGENCVRKSTDLPFPAGITTVTWTAFSHDTAGPWTDEEAHRTGNATCQQIITVNDVTPPTITVSPQQASADANCLAPVPDYSTSATVSDNCACSSSDVTQNCQGRERIMITQDPAPGTMVGLGPHAITLTANDGSSNNNGAGNTTVVQTTFTVNDTTPPTFTFVPPAVISYTGPGATTCNTVVSDATLGTATATDNCSAVTITRSPTGNTFPVGTTTVTWTATDVAGNFATATQTVTVIDNTPPIITLNGQTPSMWPPNHKYRTFQVTDFVTGASDNCGGIGISDVVIDRVTSDEIENGNGDGNTMNDIVIAANCKSVQLRSEREGDSDGRVYTITFRVTDIHGNTTTATARVVVPHNPGETPIDSGIRYTVIGSCP